MPRKIVISKKDRYNDIQNVLKQERGEENITTTALVERAGGSISNLPVQTKEFKQWLQTHQAVNPFIGKHVEAAPEYFVEEKKLNEEVLNITQVDPSVLNTPTSTDAYNPDLDNSELVDDSMEALKNNDHDKKFIDIAIIENVTKLMLTSSSEQIKTHAEEALRVYHKDDAYATKISMDNIIENSKILFIEQQKESTKLLN